MNTDTLVNESKARVKAAYERLSDWRKVGAEFGGMHPMTLWRFANDADYVPKATKVRRLLNLPVLVTVESCHLCGNVHGPRACPVDRARRPRRSPTGTAGLAVNTSISLTCQRCGVEDGIQGTDLRDTLRKAARAGWSITRADGTVCRACCK